jgi:selenide,water dikinase
MAAMGLIPAGLYANKKYSGGRVEIIRAGRGGDVLTEDIVFDPQTSGGLLLAVESDAADELAARLKPRFPHVRQIGNFSRGGGGIRIR